MKIRKYVKQRNVSQMPESIQRIIRDRNDEARKLESHARSLIEKAIVEGKSYVHGEILDLKYGSAKEKLDEAMKNLVESRPLPECGGRARRIGTAGCERPQVALPCPLY